MTYEQFLNQFISPINSFISWLSDVANSLITNYIFLTFIGITLFVSLIYFLTNHIIDYFNSKRNDIDKYQDRYSDYKLYQKVKNDFMYREPNLYFENTYKDFTFKKSVQDLYRELDNPNSDDRIFSYWHDKSTGIPLSKAEEKELNDILEKF